MKDINVFLSKKAKPADFVILSYDPENETVEEWSAYKVKLKVNQDNWHFLIGENPQTHQIASKLGLGDYWKVEGHVVHGFRVVVYNKGELLTVFSSSHPVNEKNLEAVFANLN